MAEPTLGYNPASPDPYVTSLLGATWTVAGPPLLKDVTTFEWDGSLQTVPVRQGLFTFKATSPNGGGYIYLIAFDYQTAEAGATGTCHFYYSSTWYTIYMYDGGWNFVVAGSRTTTGDLSNATPGVPATCIVHTGAAKTSMVKDSTGITLGLTIEFLSPFYGKPLFRGNVFDTPQLERRPLAAATRVR